MNEDIPNLIKIIDLNPTLISDMDFIKKYKDKSVFEEKFYPLRNLQNIKKYFPHPIRKFPFFFLHCPICGTKLKKEIKKGEEWDEKDILYSCDRCIYFYAKNITASRGYFPWDGMF